MTRKKLLPFGAITALATLGFSSVAFAQLDDDNDGVSNTAESTILLTDPAVPGFATIESLESPLGLVVLNPNFNDPALLGEYAGVVYDPQTGLIGYLSLTMAKGGKFTAVLDGTGTRSSLRGAFSGGLYTGSALSKVSFVADMAIELHPETASDPQNYRISGRLISGGTGVDQYFELRRAKYTKKVGQTSPFNGNTTFVVNRNVPSPIGPIKLGDGYGTAKLLPDGSQSFLPTLPDGTRLAFKGKTRNGDIMPVFAATKGKGARSFVANYQIDTLPVGSDYSGYSRIFRVSTQSNDLFAAGYAEERQSDGAFYVKPGFGKLPNFSIPATNNNVLVNFIDGTLAGVSRPSTWDVKGNIAAPQTQAQKLALKANITTGEFAGTYYTDDFITKTTSKVAGVTQQKRSATVGNYYSAFSTGSAEIVANVNNDQPDITVVSPSKFTVKQPGQTVQVIVQQSDAQAVWDVVVDPGVTWIQSTIDSGVGSGVVNLIISENTFGFERSGVVTIAGQKIKITQKAFFNN